MLKLEIEKNKLYTTIITLIYNEMVALRRPIMPSKGILSIRSEEEFKLLKENLAILTVEKFVKWHDYYALRKIKSLVQPDLPSDWVIYPQSPDKMCNDDKKSVPPDVDSIIDLTELLENDHISETDPESVVISVVSIEKGTYTEIDDKKIKYTPPPGFSGWDRIKYSVIQKNLNKADTAYLYLKVTEVPPKFVTVESAIPTKYKQVNIPTIESVYDKLKLTDIIQYSRYKTIPTDNRPDIIVYDLEEKDCIYADVYDDLTRTNARTDEILTKDPITGELVYTINTIEWPDPVRVPTTVIKPFEGLDSNLVWTYHISEDGTPSTLDLKPYLLEWKLPPLKLLYREYDLDGLHNPVKLALNKYSSVVTSQSHNAYAFSNTDVSIQIINTGTDKEPVYYFEVTVTNNTLNEKVLNVEANPVKSDNKPRQFVQYIANDDLVSKKGKAYYDFVRRTLLDDLRQVLSIH